MIFRTGGFVRACHSLSGGRHITGELVELPLDLGAHVVRQGRVFQRAFQREHRVACLVHALEDLGAAQEGCRITGQDGLDLVEVFQSFFVFTDTGAFVGLRQQLAGALHRLHIRLAGGLRGRYGSDSRERSRRLRCRGRLRHRIPVRGAGFDLLAQEGQVVPRHECELQNGKQPQQADRHDKGGADRLTGNGRIRGRGHRAVNLNGKIENEKSPR